MKEKQIAIKVARQAGKELKKLFLNGNYTVTNKSKHEIVTTADKLAEKIILKEIKKNFPTHQILSEESGLTKNKSDFVWIVDPLDGTTNFSLHNPLFAVSIALTYKNEPILGVVYVPMMNDIYFAIKNNGAYLNNQKLTVSKTNKLENSITTYCHGKKLSEVKLANKIYNQLKLKGKDCRHLGTAAIELAMVARGLTEAFVIPGAMSWDVAAGALLVREAGGLVTDFNSNDWNSKSKNILASNRKIDQEFLKIIKKI